MKKKDYRKPTVEVVEYEQEVLLLAGSYDEGNANDPFEDGGDPLNP